MSVEYISFWKSMWNSNPFSVQCELIIAEFARLRNFLCSIKNAVMIKKKWSYAMNLSSCISIFSCELRVHMDTHFLGIITSIHNGSIIGFVPSAQFVTVELQHYLPWWFSAFLNQMPVDMFSWMVWNNPRYACKHKLFKLCLGILNRHSFLTGEGLNFSVFLCALLCSPLISVFIRDHKDFIIFVQETDSVWPTYPSVFAHVRLW